MKKRILNLVAALTLIFTVAFVAPVGIGHAACSNDFNSGALGGIACGSSPVGATTAVTRAINILLYIVGIISIFVIIVGALRYVLSGGNAQQTSGAKDTILYAVIGLVVALLAYAIVNFVLKQFGA